MDYLCKISNIVGINKTIQSNAALASAALAASSVLVFAAALAIGAKAVSAILCATRELNAQVRAALQRRRDHNIARMHLAQMSARDAADIGVTREQLEF